MSRLPKSRAGLPLPIFAVLIAPMIVGSLAGQAGVTHLDSPYFAFIGLGAVITAILFWLAAKVPGCLLAAVVVGLGAMESIGILLGPCCDNQGVGFLAIGAFLVAIPCVTLLAIRVEPHRVAADDRP